MNFRFFNLIIAYKDYNIAVFYVYSLTWIPLFKKYYMTNP